MEHSKKYEDIKRWYDSGLWTSEMVWKAVPKLITKAEAKEITQANKNS